MAKLWFLVIVLLCLQEVFSRECSSLAGITQCDECIRCGGIWCTALEEFHCRASTDDWCPSHREKLPTVKATLKPGTFIKPQFMEKSVLVGDPDEDITLQYKLLDNAQPKVNIEYFNSSITNLNRADFETRMVKTHCSKHGDCATVISVKPTVDFCPLGASVSETVTLRISIDGVAEEAVAMYHVPCGCGCSEKVEKASVNCSGNGDYSCGACSCYKGWKGLDCSTKPQVKPDCDRGDVSGCIHPITNTVCSNNGECSCDGKCECFKDRPGYMFFDEYCADICTAVSSCDACLMNPTPGQCMDCNFPLIIENATDIPSDPIARKVWVICNETTENGLVVYGATRNTTGGVVHIIVMGENVIPEHQSPPVKVTVPVVLGVIALIAAAAAVAGFMVWKNKTPPLPLTDPQYQNIDAEDCTGMNPLYKPPTSSFKNPTYGKW